MKKFLQKKLKDQKGMTLIELLAVIVIIAIIAAIAIPAIGNIIDNSRIDAAKSDALNIISGASLYEAQENAIPAAGVLISDLVDKGFIEDAGSLEDTGKVYPGPAINTTATDLVANGDLVFGTAAVPLDKNAITGAEATSDTRKGLEAADGGSYSLK